MDEQRAGAAPVTLANAPPSPASQPAALTPELVRIVAAKVYALWLLDLKLERERWRKPANYHCYAKRG